MLMLNGGVSDLAITVYSLAIIKIDWLLMCRRVTILPLQA